MLEGDRMLLSSQKRAAMVAVAAIVACISPFARATDVARVPVPNGELPFTHIGTDLGLGELGAWQVAQDSVGYLWIAAENGIYRYDGRHAVHFGLQEGLPAPYATQVAVGHDDGVWAVTSAGLARYREGRWFSVWPPGKGLGLQSVQRIAIGPDGLLWATTTSGMLRESEDGSVAIDPSYPSAGLDALAFAGTTILVGERDGLHVKTDLGANPPTPVETVMTKGLAGDRIGDVARDPLGRIWAISPRGVFVAHPGEVEFRGPLDAPCDGDTRIVMSPEGVPWFASAEGLFYADDHERLVRTIGLTNDYLGGGFFDREGSLWAVGFGLHRFAGGRLFRGYFERNGLPSSTIWSIKRVDGALWVGTGLGVARADARGWSAITEIPREPIRSIVPTPDGDVWLSGPVGKVFRVTPATHQVETFDKRRGLPDSKTMALNVDRTGTVWVGTFDAGVWRSVGTGDARRFERLDLRTALAPSEKEGDWSARDVAIDSGGRTLIAGDQGLIVIDGDKLRIFTDADGLRITPLDYVLIRSTGELCLAYRLSFGVDCFSLQDDKLTRTARFDVASGLSSDIVYLLGEDWEGALWIGTNAGADRWDGHQMAHFGTQDGLPSFDCDARSFAADDNGDVWIGTSRGLGRFIGSEYKGVPEPPHVAIEAVHAGKSGQTPLAEGERVRAGDGAVEFQFSALSYLHESAMLYESRLIGASSEWSEATGDRRRYDSLAPASYAFEVRARHPGGAWGPTATRSFVITPLWWQTSWARALGAAMVGLLFAAGIRLRSRALAERNRELSLLVEERTKALAKAQSDVSRQEKLSALGRVLAQLSHELNNPMNVVRNNVGPLREYVATLSKALHSFQAESRGLPDGGDALREFWELHELDFVLTDSSAALTIIERAAERVSRIQADLSTFLRGGEFEKKEGDLENDIEETVSMMRQGLPPDVTFVTSYAGVAKARYDAGRMNQVFMNLFQNAIHAVGSSGTVTVRTWSEPGFACVEIRDTGTGVPAHVRQHIFEPFFTTKPIGKGTGLGLSVCRQIVVEQHGGTLELAEDVGVGAAFVVRLPA